MSTAGPVPIPGEALSGKPPWKPRVAAISGFFFGPLGAALVSYANLKRLGKPRKAKLVLLWTAAACVPLVVLLLYLPERAQKIFGLAIQAANVGLFPILQYQEFERWKANQAAALEATGLKPAVRTASGWKALGRGLAGLASFLALAVGLALAQGAVVDHYLARGDELRKQKLYGEAEHQYRRAHRMAPNELAPLASLAALLVERGQTGRAVEVYREIARREPQAAHFRAVLGMGLADVGKLDEALSECSEALRLDPELPSAHVCLAWVLHSKGELTQAVEEYCQALRLDPQTPDAERLLREALLAQGDPRANHPNPCAAPEGRPKQKP